MMFHGWDGAHMNVLCLSCLSWYDYSSSLSIQKEGDGVFPAGIVAGGGGGGTPGCQTPVKKIRSDLQTYNLRSILLTRQEKTASPSLRASFRLYLPPLPFLFPQKLRTEFD